MHLVERRLLKAKILEHSTGPLTEVQGYIIDSCIARGDLEQARKNIGYWNDERARVPRPKRGISKWIPGDHFYALGEKFRTLELAIEHLESEGFAFDGIVRERFQYRENGG